MANGDLCIHCDMQETVHLYPEYLAKGVKTCGHFESPVKHDEGCPVIDCNGNCQATLRQQAQVASWAQDRLRNSWFISRRTGNIVPIDLSD